MKEFWSNYFNFTRAERNAILVLAWIAIIISLAPSIINHLFPKKYILNQNAQEWLTALEHDTIATQDKTYNHSTYTKHKYYDNQEINEHIFDNDNIIRPVIFDPNTADLNTLLHLGFKKYVAENLIKYRATGARVKQAKDLLKIYGMTNELYQKLLPYIVIKEYVEDYTTTTPSSTSPSPSSKAVTTSNYSRTQYIVDINTADTSDFKRLPYIGTRLADRIVKYRNSLGGFISVSQFAEVYGIQDSIFQKLLPQLQISKMNAIKKININLTTIEELKHPYLNKNLTKLIIEYRNQHGEYTDLEQLKEIKPMDANTYQKIIPYLSL